MINLLHSTLLTNNKIFESCLKSYFYLSQNPFSCPIHLRKLNVSIKISEKGAESKNNLPQSNVICWAFRAVFVDSINQTKVSNTIRLILLTFDNWPNSLGLFSLLFLYSCTIKRFIKARLMLCIITTTDMRAKIRSMYVIFWAHININIVTCYSWFSHRRPCCYSGSASTPVFTVFPRRTQSSRNDVTLLVVTWLPNHQSMVSLATKDHCQSYKLTLFYYWHLMPPK